MSGAPHPLVAEARAAAQAGAVAEAARLARARLAQAPDDLDALEVQAVAQRALGDLAGAIASLRAALALDPGAAWAHADLILALHEAGDIVGAEGAARAALGADPDNADAHNLLGALRSEQDDLPGGERHLRRAIALAGAHAQIVRNLAINLARQGRVDEAGALFEQVLRANPGDGEAAAHWARACETQGRLDEAMALLDHAEAAGRDVSLQRAITLSRMGRHQDGLAVIAAARGPLSADALLARGRMLDKLGRSEEAWAAFNAGKDKLAAQDASPYDAAAVSARFAEIAATVTPALMAALPRAEQRADTPQPLFILGFPRSGTTMLEQMFSAHSAVRAGGELPFLHEAASRFARLTGGAYPGGIARLTSEEAQQIGALLRDFYLSRADEYGLTAPGAALFTDKMPLNEVYLPLIRLAFPDAAVIRIVRHPLDVAVSMLSHNMTHGARCGYRLADIAHHLTATSALADTLEAACGGVARVRYEDFVSRQEAETRRLIAHAGLGFEEACLAFHENPRVAPTPSYAQVSAPLNDASVGRWRAYAAQLAPVRAMLAALAARYGYEA